MSPRQNVRQLHPHALWRCATRKGQGRLVQDEVGGDNEEVAQMFETLLPEVQRLGKAPDGWTIMTMTQCGNGKKKKLEFKKRLVIQ